jgi:hypothetical protein
MLAQKEFEKIFGQWKNKFVIEHLNKENAGLFKSLSEIVSKQLALERDPHGRNVRVSLSIIEQLLTKMVGKTIRPMEAFIAFLNKC